ncbi:DUF6862 domain-containing protein [uncultured Pantoea sp.]|uniref:DUF6862 domain-containing protein n=1 Tax=unclassified Pantoea TaxID=2630326 RepID=UPI00345A0FCE
MQEAERKAILQCKEKAGTITPDERQELSSFNQTDKIRDQAIHDICTQGNKGSAACRRWSARLRRHCINTATGLITRWFTKICTRRKLQILEAY